MQLLEEMQIPSPPAEHSSLLARKLEPRRGAQHSAPVEFDGGAKSENTSIMFLPFILWPTFLMKRPTSASARTNPAKTNDSTTIRLIYLEKMGETGPLAVGLQTFVQGILNFRSQSKITTRAGEREPREVERGEF